jgi:two-component SAPR family response regulator
MLQESAAKTADRAIRLLVLDDDVVTAAQFAHAAQSCGARVVGPFCREDEAIGALFRARPDAVLLDIRLGEEATSEGIAARAKAAGIPILFVSGYTDAMLPMMDSFPSALFTAKPLTREMLACAIDRIAEAARR